MTTVTVAEARENLPELLRRAAAGEYIAITDDGKWVASLAPPMPALSPVVQDEAERRAKAAELERLIAQWHEEDGLPYPPPGESRIFPLPESPAA
jgi:antitoxin (DNA-binding transcriptional repressor) of toxin-antitoxin stability system